MKYNIVTNIIGEPTAGESFILDLRQISNFQKFLQISNFQIMHLVIILQIN